MQELRKIVDLLEDKLHLILERYEFLKEENEYLRGNYNDLQQQLNEKKQLLKEFELNVDSSKVARAIQGSDDTEKTTKKINTLIKDIDLCIAQLSD